MTPLQISRALIRLNQNLEEILLEEERVVKTKLKSNPLASFVLAFVMKTKNLLKGVSLLHDNQINESVEIISKSLLELNVTFLYFLKLYMENPSVASQRFVDCMMLEIIENIRHKRKISSKCDEVTNSLKNLCYFEQAIQARYNQVEFDQLKSHGFSGKEVSEMVKTLEIHNEWDLLTKEFPMQAHSFHFYPLFSREKNGMTQDFIQSRLLDNMHIACLSAGCIASSANEALDCGLNERIRLIQKNLTSLKSIDQLSQN